MPPVNGEIPQVIVLPLHQLLGRAFGAIVIPGCDDRRLPASPEPPGNWSAAQRLELGLPSREALEAAQRAAWKRGPVQSLVRTAVAQRRCQRRARAAQPAGAGPRARPCARVHRRSAHAARCARASHPLSDALGRAAAAAQRVDQRHRGPAPPSLPLLRAAPARPAQRRRARCRGRQARPSATGCMRCSAISTRRCSRRPRATPASACLHRGRGRARHARVRPVGRRVPAFAAACPRCATATSTGSRAMRPRARSSSSPNPGRNSRWARCNWWAGSTASTACPTASPS